MPVTWDDLLAFALTLPDTAASTHYDGHGSVLLRLSEATMDAEVRELVTEAWRIGESQATA